MPEDLKNEAFDQKVALESCIVFLLMSKHDNHHQDMLHRLKQQLSTTFKHIILDPSFPTALRLFSTFELIVTPFPGQRDVIELHQSLNPSDHLNPDSVMFFKKQLNDRIVQHNLRVVARYYKRVRMSRLCSLLALAADTLEEHMSEISSAGDLYLKIDRPAGIVTFQEPLTAEQVLSDWSADVSSMLQVMEATCHLINRENMVHKV